MTREQLIENLDDILSRTIGYVDRETIIAARAAIAPTPPPPGSVEVRIGVAVNDTGGVYAWVDRDDSPEDPHITHEATVAACIPPCRQIPTVVGTVEPAFDPEATV